MRFPSHRARWGSMGLAVLLLSACASPGPEHSPASKLTPAQLGLAQPVSSSLDAQWWTQWQQAALNQTIERALHEHPSLAVAQARWRMTQAALNASQAIRAPQIGVGYDVTRERFSQNGFYPPPIAGNVYSIGNAQVGGSWDLDAFGQRTAEIAAGLDQTRAAQADADAAALTLASQITKTYLALARWVSQDRLLGQIEKNQEEIAALAQQRVQAGMENDSAYQGARNTLQNLRVARAQVQEQQVLLRHQLAALSAQSPQALDSLQPDLAKIALPQVDGQLGLDLIARRPDVNAAKWRVEASLQGVKASERLFYPNVSLNGFAGVSAIGMSKVFESASRQQGVGLAFHLPLFDGGRLRALLKSKQSELDMGIALYNNALLEAVRESADAIGSLHSLETQAQAMQQALQASERVYAHAQARHDAGLSSRIALLQSQVQWLEQQRQYIDVLARQHLGQVDLIKALGGGWHSPTVTDTPP
jgi:NodT family efflux transporter outer membrane factor (OMF) lipoprotein